MVAAAQRRTGQRVEGDTNICGTGTAWPLVASLEVSRFRSVLVYGDLGKL